MKKYAQFTLVVIVFFILVWVRQNGGDSAEHPVLLSPQQQTVASTLPAATPAPTVTATSTTTTPPPQKIGKYKDGTYTGSVADAYYGNVQVQAVVAGGKLTAVNILQYPSDNRTSRSINSQALPILQSEAIQAQSANVDMVSGASATSPAFIQSLQDALAQAS